MTSKHSYDHIKLESSLQGGGGGGGEGEGEGRGEGRVLCSTVWNENHGY